MFSTVPLDSLEYNSQRFNRLNRGLELVTDTSKKLVLIKVDWRSKHHPRREVLEFAVAVSVLSCSYDRTTHRKGEHKRKGGFNHF